MGRDRELDRLREHLDAVRRGHGRLVFVTGEAGQGKTALLSAFAEQAQRAVPELVVARGAGTAIGSYGDPDLLIRDVFRMLLADPLAPLPADLLTPAQAKRVWEFAPVVARTVDRVVHTCSIPLSRSGHCGSGSGSARHRLPPAHRRGTIWSTK